MYPEQGLTKRALAEFYRDVADWILPEVVGRPLALVRCPEGRGTQCFFQKHAWPGMPEAIRRRRIGRGEDAEEVLFIEDRDGLLSLVQVGVLEIHVWGARLDAVEHPDRMVFDLDPDPAASWGQVVEGARMVRDLLARVGLESHVRTTGGKGLHVVVGLAPRHGWDEVKQFAHAVSRTLAAAYPDRFTARLPKAQRKGKVFLDYLRNGRGATAIASYSTRARAGAPVATPIAWRELRESLAPDRYTVDNLRERLRRLRADPWQDLVGQRQRLPDAERIARG